jgi:hypothetical protein
VYNELPVARSTHVQFNPVHPRLLGGDEGGYRVFPLNCVKASVGVNLGHGLEFDR